MPSACLFSFLKVKLLEKKKRNIRPSFFFLIKAKLTSFFFISRPAARWAGRQNVLAKLAFFFLKVLLKKKKRAALLAVRQKRKSKKEKGRAQSFFIKKKARRAAQSAKRHKKRAEIKKATFRRVSLLMHCFCFYQTSRMSRKN